ncbi:MAG: NAD(P)/FAD-dependent oxidoreductase [Treponema sp.]|jgi:NADPH-dependent 2,4-dienoyl-CoA reductase/sulfur reductase-like enzyme|nr:NAD(P)/FAD-dependent oxidoreductase [Treponema sp.]
MKERQNPVVVIGGGPAGMAAALEASREGARALVLDRNRHPGGILNQCIHDGFGLIRFGESLSGPEYAGFFARQMESDTNIEYVPGAAVTGITGDLKVSGLSRRGAFCYKAGAVVLATGCRERTRGALAIPGSRPAGIFTAGVAQQLINTCNIAVGKRALILGSGDIGLIMARRLSLTGVEVTGVFEKLPYCSGLPRNRYQCLDDFDIPLHLNKTVTGIHGTKRLESVTVSSLDEYGNPVPKSEYRISCDTLILSVGLIPENEIALRLGAALLPATKGIRADSHLESSVPGVFSCGNSLHVNDLADNVTEEGGLAGRWAARHALGKITGGAKKVPVRHGAGIRYTSPQTVYAGESAVINLRVNAPGIGKTLRFLSGNRALAEKVFKHTSPAEMISLKVPVPDTVSGAVEVELL